MSGYYLAVKTYPQGYKCRCFHIRSWDRLLGTIRFRQIYQEIDAATLNDMRVVHYDENFRGVVEPAINQAFGNKRAYRHEKF